MVITSITKVSASHAMKQILVVYNAYQNKTVLAAYQSNILTMANALIAILSTLTV
jgi:hypothetical protein